MTHRADTLAAVSAALASVWTSQGRSFATFEHEDDDALFVQYVDGVLNVAWPFEREPAERLRRDGVTLPAGGRVAAWTPGATAQLAVGDARAGEVAEFVLRLFERVLAPDGRARLVTRIDADR